MYVGMVSSLVLLNAERPKKNWKAQRVRDAIGCVDLPSGASDEDVRGLRPIACHSKRIALAHDAPETGKHLVMHKEDAEVEHDDEGDDDAFPAAWARPIKERGGSRQQQRRAYIVFLLSGSHGWQSLVAPEPLEK